MEKRLFLGANTADGFKSYFEERLKFCDRIYILKGGPGTGKSTLIRKVATKAKESGADFETWYCSGDVKSLDGIYIKSKNTAIVDGTNPHAIEATLPVVKEKVIALGDFIDEKKILPYGEEIARLCKSKAAHYVKAYRRLKCAKLCIDEINADFIPYISMPKMTQICSSLAYHVRKAAKVSKQLSRAISPQGIVSFYDHLVDKQIILLKSECQAQTEIFFEKMSQMLCGYDAYMTPLGCGIEGMVVGRYAIVEDCFDYEPQETVDLSVTLKKAVKADEVATAEYERQMGLAINELAAARENHLAVENYYVPAMNFDKVGAVTEKIIGEIFNDL